MVHIIEFTQFVGSVPSVITSSAIILYVELCTVGLRCLLVLYMEDGLQGQDYQSVLIDISLMENDLSCQSNLCSLL